MSTSRPAFQPPSTDAVTVLTGFVVVLLVIPSPMVFTALGQVGGPATMIALLCFLWWTWHRVHLHVERPHIPHPVRNTSLLLLLCVALTYIRSAGLALPGDERSPADAALIRMVGAVGLICVFAEGVVDRDRLWVLVRRWTLLVGGLSALALVQIFTKQVWVDRVSIPGLSSALNLTLIQRGIITRPSGTSTHPIEFAAVMAMSMPMAFAAASQETVRPRLFKAIAVSVPVVVLMTGSRTAILCGGVAFIVTLASWRPRARLFAGVAAVFVLIGMFVLLPGFLGGLRNLFSGAENDPSVRSRTDSYRIAALYWNHHQWFGRGWGTFLPKYWVFDNMYLSILVGGGIVGVVATLALIVVAVRAALRARRLSTTEADRQLATAALAGVLSGAAALATFDVFSFPQAAGTFFLLIGLCGALLRLGLEEQRATEGELGLPTGTTEVGA